VNDKKATNDNFTIEVKKLLDEHQNVIDVVGLQEWIIFQLYYKYLHKTSKCILEIFLLLFLQEVERKYGGID